MTFICFNIELRTQPLIILIVIAGTDKERPGCSKIRSEQSREIAKQCMPIMAILVLGKCSANFRTQNSW
jgi:hypothetical protein